MVIKYSVCYTNVLLKAIKERRGIVDKDILTINEAAAFLKVGKRTIYKLVQEGKIPAKKVLNKWRFEKERLIKWIADGK
ncbi:MAG: helix-turn-helix domain-containing protein [Deltaproteobacteria bacterium]|nr:helix-turn-helix domain-containing protein [Deltaproteobacteria bacterium]